MLDLCRTDQVLRSLGVQSQNVPCLRITLASAVPKAGLYILQGARNVLPWYVMPWTLLTNECKEPQPTIIFTISPDAPFSSYTPESVPYKNEKLAISFETEEMMQHSLVLLRSNCPDSSCDYTATGWSDLKLHVRSIHSRFMWCVPICLPRPAMV